MTITITRQASIALVTIDHPPVNALARAVRQGLVDAVATLDAEPGIDAVVLTCAGRTFIAGADVSEFDKPPEAPHLPDVVAAIETAAKPWIAAIHGSALGGGLEIALGCAWRLAVTDASLGLPEVRLGLIPGAGGTVRLPRLVGVEAAIDMVTTGTPMKAPKALAIGLIDRLIDGDLLAGAMAFAQETPGQPRPVPLSRRPAPEMAPDAWEKAAIQVSAKARGEAAPLRALASLQTACTPDFASAMVFERETFLSLRASSEAAALRHVFFAERAAPRPPELAGVAARAIATAAVIGGGTMGAGIAAALRDAGLPVVLIERDREATDRGLANLRGIYDGAVKRGRMSPAEAEARLAGVIASDDYAMLCETDLVIEAVFEDLAVKRAVFERLSAVCRPDAVLATNTSYLDPGEIASGIRNPERFLGLHFFSPAHVMKLLEIVPTDDTAQDVLATGFGLALLLGKIPVRAGICDGFIGNRILKVTRAQAERLLLAGTTPAAVDAAMRAFGLPMGPFEAQDLGGLDIAALQRKAARARGAAPFAPIAERLYAAGRLGQKTQGGWYDYTTGNRTPQPSDMVAAIIAEEAADRPRLSLDAERLADAIVLPMVNEACSILEEGVALRAADIDLVKIHGYGFPRWRGGPMRYAEARGLAGVATALKSLAQQGLAEPPGAALERAAEVGSFSALTAHD